MEMFADNTSLGDDNDNWQVPFIYKVPGDTRVISVIGRNHDDGIPFAGILGSTSNGLLTNETWKCSSDLYPGWNSPDFDDRDWPLAKVVGNHGDDPWKTRDGIAKAAKWIWANNTEYVVYCRLILH